MGHLSEASPPGQLAVRDLSSAQPWQNLADREFNPSTDRRILRRLRELEDESDQRLHDKTIDETHRAAILIVWRIDQ